MLGRNHDQGRLVEAALLELSDHLPDRTVGELDLTEQRLGRRADIVQIAARHAHGFLYELLAHADYLKIHPEDARYPPVRRAAVVLAADLIQDRLHLQAVVTPN